MKKQAARASAEAVSRVRMRVRGLALGSAPGQILICLSGVLLCALGVTLSHALLVEVLEVLGVQWEFIDKLIIIFAGAPGKALGRGFG